MKTLTLEQHRSRIENIRSAEDNTLDYFVRHRIRDYMPGQAIYNLGDYPAPFSISPTDYDRALLKELRDRGVEMIQIHEEWNDALRYRGADKYTSFDPEGLHAFVELCHSLGLKIIPYISTGYLHELDPDFREEFVRERFYCQEGMYYKYVKCWAGSAAWRDYLIPRTLRAIDEYGFDGVFNDMGYDGRNLAKIAAKKAGKSEYTVEYGAELEDLLCTIYSEIKSRGGVYKLHADGNFAPPCRDKVYDYLWIGEGVTGTKPGIGKEYDPYVVPCPDYARTEAGNYERHFARTIPFLQFPLLTRGRPLLGNNTHEPLPRYGNDGPGSEYDFNRRVEAYMKEHPDGPYVYSLWSAIPDPEDHYPTWCEYLSLYRPMVEENSLVYVEIRRSRDILSPLPEGVIASLFVNEEKYLVLSNFTEGDYELELAERWRDRRSGLESARFTVKPGKILFLKK